MTQTPISTLRIKLPRELDLRIQFVDHVPGGPQVDDSVFINVKVDQGEGVLETISKDPSHCGGPPKNAVC